MICCIGVRPGPVAVMSTTGTPGSVSAGWGCGAVGGMARQLPFAVRKYCVQRARPVPADRAMGLQDRVAETTDGVLRGRPGPARRARRLSARTHALPVTAAAGWAHDAG